MGSISSLYTTNHLYEYQSKTHTIAAELQSRFSPSLNNEARFSYVRVRDQRTSGAAAPSIVISNVGKGSVGIGNEGYSMANGLDQDVYTFEDNLTWLRGSHAFTFGTHNEVYKFTNLFLPNLYGAYTFNSPQDFFDVVNGTADGSKIASYAVTQGNIDVTGNAMWAPSFSAAQLGFYLQDKWDATNNFQLTYGLRMDIPVFFDAPTENAEFNKWAADNDYSFKTNRKLSSTPMWSPRVGFRWDIKNDRKFILRGGVGVFTGRIPFVWLSNSFSNTGVQTSKYNVQKNPNVQLILNPNEQNKNTENLKASGSQEVDVFDKNFKFAQNLRLNLGFDFNLLGIDWTAEAIFSKTLNDIYYKNLAYEESGKTVGQELGLPWESRPSYQKVKSASKYSGIYAMYNTSKGYSYNLSLQGTKRFAFGLDLSASYTFTQSKSVSSAVSSQALSNWNNTHTYRFSNNPELANSAFNIPHLVKASAFYHLNWGPKKLFTTTVGLIYQGQSGSPYSLLYKGDINGDNSRSNDLIYIPTDDEIDKMQFKEIKGIEPEQQRQNMKEWLANTRYVKNHRGEFYKRYADNLPFESHFDFHFDQKFGIKIGKYVHRLEVSMDIMNVANLLNKKWGRTLSSSYGSEFISPITYNGDGTFSFSYEPTDPVKYASDYYSRWRGQVGVKYTF